MVTNQPQIVMIDGIDHQLIIMIHSSMASTTLHPPFCAPHSATAKTAKVGSRAVGPVVVGVMLVAGFIAVSLVVNG